MPGSRHLAVTQRCINSCQQMAPKACSKGDTLASQASALKE